MEFNDYFKIHEFSMHLRMRRDLRIGTTDQSYLYAF